jgi:hypothetical protein
MGDTGTADRRLAAALTAPGVRRPGTARAEVLAALAGARVFAAVTAISTAEHVDGATGLRAESTAEMALLTLVGSAGGRAVPLFLDAGSAVGFRPGARPVPLQGRDACRAALEDGAVGVLLDPPGAALPVTDGELHELANGRVPVAGAALSSQVTADRLSSPAEVGTGLLARLADALRTEPVRAARVLQGPDGLVVGLVPEGELGPAALAALASRVLPWVGDPALAVAVVPPSGPGVPVPLRPQRWGRQRWGRRRWVRRE